MVRQAVFDVKTGLQAPEDVIFRELGLMLICRAQLNFDSVEPVFPLALENFPSLPNPPAPSVIILDPSTATFEIQGQTSQSTQIQLT